MRLFMDLGNSQAKWALESDLEREQVQQASSAEPAGLVPQLRALPEPSAVFIASVLSPQRTQALSDWMQTHWQLRPHFAETRKAELGVVNGYRQPRQLGVDRWLGLLAAREISKQPLLIVDCGTATTLDAMDGDGNHLGGLILPGLQLFQRCLIRDTDIPESDDPGAVSGFASDTAAGIASAAMLATSASIEAAMKDLQQRVGAEVVCMLTGGFAPRVKEYLSVNHSYVPHLILQGLALQAGRTDR
jgi:type III pantothenate kinase